MSATASGSKAASDGNTKSRDHKQGNQERKYTIEQKTTVMRVRRCAPTAFYEILSLEKTASDGDIKKAYRKLSLLTHPDKNGYEGADEAFKMVSRAFQILSDPDKKSRFDQFGGDPDSRFSGNSSGGGGGGGAGTPSSPFAGFTRSAAGRNPMFDAEISPEDLFNQFFGGAAGGGFASFGGGMGGPGLVFNMGGGPGIRVHQFGGMGPQRRPRNSAGQEETQPSGLAALTQLLPVLLLFVLPLLSSLFTGSSSSGPEVLFHRAPPHVLQRTTPRFQVNYYLNPTEVDGYSDRKFRQLDQTAEVKYINALKYECQLEQSARNQKLEEAQGWFSTDERKLKEARSMPMKSCNRLNNMGVPRQY